MRIYISLILLALIPTLSYAIEFESRNGFAIIKYEGEWTEGEVIEIFKHTDLYSISAFTEWDKNKNGKVHTVTIKLKGEKLDSTESAVKEKIKISGIREDERDALLKFLTS